MMKTTTAMTKVHDTSRNSIDYLSFWIIYTFGPQNQEHFTFFLQLNVVFIIYGL